MGIQPAGDVLRHNMQEVFEDLFTTEKIFEGSPMVRDWDNFLGKVETEEGWADLMEKFLHR